MLLTGKLLPVGDADYLIQTVLAARISIIEYAQFPWWNPWVAGGVPLFANPQFGLISLPMFFGFLAGPILGYKLAIVGYFLLGFFGLLLLFRKGMKTPLLTSILLSYVWTFGSFLTYRSLGHYTFLTLQFLPYILYFYLRRKEIKYSWAYFGVFSGLAALSAAHNMTVMAYVFLAIFIIIDAIKLKRDKENETSSSTLYNIRNDLIFLVKAGGIFLLMTGYRLFFTLQYLQDFPRLQTNNPEPTMGVEKALFAIFGPFRQFNNPPEHPQWSWMEASAYIGIATGLAALIILIALMAKRIGKKDFSYNPGKVLIVFGICFALGLGDFIGEHSPYLLFRELPVLSSMRVASRWLVFCSLAVLLFIGCYKGLRLRRAINFLLIISVIELVIMSQPQLAKPYLFSPDTPKRAQTFEQQRLYGVHRRGIAADENLTKTTLSNYGQVIAGDSLVDTRDVAQTPVDTLRCDVDDGCNFVLTDNAKVEYWSPNKIILQRQDQEPVKLNLNPGSCWLINGRYAFLGYRAAEPEKEFLIQDTSDRLTVECMPRFSIQWAIRKATDL